MNINTVIGIVSTIIVSLFITLVFIIVIDINERNENEQNYLAMNDELISSGLLSEKIEIEREIRILSDKEKRRVSTITILFRTPNRQIYDGIRAIMSPLKMTGTICISKNSMPSDSGNVTVAQYKALLNEGYSGAVLYDGTAELSEYLEEVKTRTESLGIELPNTLYVFGKVENKNFWLTKCDAEGRPQFTEEQKNVLENYGIKHVVQETYQTKSVSYQNFYDEFQYCEALGFNSKDGLPGESLLDSIKRKAALVFSVQFEFSGNQGAFYGEYNVSGNIGDTRDDFGRMLNVIYGYGEQIKTISISAVAAYRKAYNEELMLDTETDEKIERLNSRLAEVNAAIQAIKNKYGQ